MFAAACVSVTVQEQTKKKPLCILGVVSEQLFNVVSVFLSHTHTHSFFQNILQCFKNKFHFLVFRSGSAYVGNQLFLPGGMDIIDRSKRFAVSHFFLKAYYNVLHVSPTRASSPFS